MNIKLLNYWETIRSSLWFIPTLMVVCAIFLAVLTTSLDENFDVTQYLHFEFLTHIQAEGARSVLTIVASSMINVTSVVFSITIVALTLASSQFGPRLLRNFMVDTGNQVVLGTFIATFIYCLLVLQSMHPTDAQFFVPSLSVLCAVLLALINIGVLIYFIHHVAISIQADHVVNAVITDLEERIESIFPVKWQPGVEESIDEEDAYVQQNAYAEQRTITARHSGYLQAIDQAALLTLATEHNVLLQSLSGPGDFVVKEAGLVTVFCEAQCDETLLEKIPQHFYIGTQRTPEQDAEFAVRQLVEIAVRALSPGINDPYTAMICVDRLSAIICQLTRRVFPSPFCYDSERKLRLITKAVTFSGVVNEAFDQIRQYGRSSASVTIRLLEACIGIAEQARNTEQREVILRQGVMIERGSRELLREENDIADVAQRFEKLIATIKQREGDT